MTLPPRAEVVVAGGGVMGVSTAFHLAEAGVDVLLLERDELGAGSTSKAAGGIRAMFSDPVNIELGRRSLRAFEEFAGRPGGEIDLKQHGYLFLLADPEDVAAFERSVELQNSLGVPSRMLTVEQARELSPYVEPDGLLAAAFSPTDGHCTPEAVVQGYAQGARRHGAVIRRHCEVTGIDVDDGEITGVRTAQGRVATSTVVCATGAWSAALGEMAGVELPVRPLRRQILVTEPVPGMPPRMPFTIDFSTSFYFHDEGPGLLIGMSDPDEEYGFRLGTDDAWLDGLSEAVARRAPALSEVGVAHGWAGLYEITPDHNALVGESAEVSRFLYATGFSGHGFLQGPAIGEVMRDLVLGRTPAVDVSGLSVRRFEGAEVRPEHNCV
ncbi:sarcosine oxidase subunit beta [Saccharopolyspora erythraea NRRL 2338]|uniref:Sarcosine oxidase subunit beta n=2 Tax=Saccharopolyspora erythraea TaxID=1836 RepID=A4FGH7_SACEN|nr:FAD-binding oxidoreductase [Saccharopolyspora erythraea]EQD83843.1 sarcosine oxidase subunit beta [Saccharopolyspora erythraea D]PFG96857.1 sarcosine oxidase subunit beta [Saccharopolyspora erythraea NRRL 2338]QRK87095.1 FAD-binding oxidoreductase [Saccharopolyspora erythraea]CAM03152.1 sarcosine oxidase subunit beta [Saccharopolyspora erythraea NRRL 2338]